MSAPEGGRARALLALLALLAVIAALLVGTCLSPSLVVLDPCGPGPWIVYPRPARDAHPLVAIEGLFRRELSLASVPRRATLRMRALGSARVNVNGCTVLDTSHQRSWKAEARADVARCLHSGPNTIVVAVANERGPPALSLAIDLEDGTIVSDRAWRASWGGATERDAVPATAAMQPPAVARSGVLPAHLAVLDRWKLVTASALAFSGVAALAHGARRRRAEHSDSPESSRWPAVAAIAAATAAWVALFVHDLGATTPFFAGFDAAGHLDYVAFVARHHRLPYADDGWQMFQAPLYYVVSASILSLAGIPAAGDRAHVALGWFGLGLAIAQLALVGASLRLLFPDRPARQVAGIVVAAALPVMIYMHLAPGNEPLLAVFASAALHTTLRLVRRDEPSWRLAAAAGLLAGLGTVVKVTGILLLAPILGAIGGRAFTARGPLRRARLVEGACATAAFSLACGWDLARTWLHFGTPFVGGWEARPGMGWWGDPGLRTVADFLRFGRTFTSPFLAGLGGFWDGLYSTLWADGLMSTAASPSLTSAGVLLATVPTIAIVAGAIATGRRWFRTPSAQDGIVLALAMAILVALALMSLRVPSVVSVKASYGLLGVIPLCAFAAEGLDRAAGRSPLRQLVVVAAIGAWATISFGAFWMDASSFENRLEGALRKIQRGDQEAGAAELRTLARDPVAHARTRLRIAELMLDNDAPPSEIERMLAPDGDIESFAEYHHLVSRLAARTGDRVRSIAAALRAIERDPQSAQLREHHAGLVTASGDVERAVEAWRDALGADVFNERAHAALADLYARLGQTYRAEQHRRWAASLSASRNAARGS